MIIEEDKSKEGEEVGEGSIGDSNHPIVGPHTAALAAKNSQNQQQKIVP